MGSGKSVDLRPSRYDKCMPVQLSAPVSGDRGRCGLALGKLRRVDDEDEKGVDVEEARGDSRGY